MHAGGKILLRNIPGLAQIGPCDFGLRELLVLQSRIPDHDV